MSIVNTPANAPETTKAKITRPRRSVAERMADLDRKAADLRAQGELQKAQEHLENDIEGSILLSQIGSLDTGIRSAHKAENSSLVEFLENHRTAVSLRILELFGVRLPATRLQVGGRKKKEEATTTSPS